MFKLLNKNIPSLGCCVAEYHTVKVILMPEFTKKTYTFTLLFADCKFAFIYTPFCTASHLNLEKLPFAYVQPVKISNILRYNQTCLCGHLY